MAKDRVLVVEDEELMRKILRELLESSGFDVFTADSAENAVEIFIANDILITLTDIKMSGKDGLALLDQIKSIDEEAIVIIMTAYSDLDSAVAAFQGGAFEYLPKPFDVDNAVELIRRALDESRKRETAAVEEAPGPEILGQAPAMQ